MHRPTLHQPTLPVVLSLGLVAIAACGDNTPTQPSNTLDHSSSLPTLGATANSWALIAPMPGQAGQGPAVGVVPNSNGLSKAYVFGGTNGDGGSGANTRVYDVATNTWRFVSNDTETRVFAFNLNGVGNIGDKLYFSGGKDYGGGSLAITAEAWAFDPASETFTRKADMPLHTADGVSGVIGDKLYVLPGTCSGEGYPAKSYCETEPIRKLFRYNPSTNIWVTKASAPHYHKNGAAGVINNKFYVVGGNKDFDAPTRALDVYDPATNTWKTLASLPVALQPVTGAALREKFYVVGGNSGGVKAYAYDPATNKWTSKAAPTVAGGSNSAAKVFLNGTSRLLMIAGAITDAPDFNGSQIYTP
jgi:N-acetylneuraminic acid mutarotase